MIGRSEATTKSEQGDKRGNQSRGFIDASSVTVKNSILSVHTAPAAREADLSLIARARARVCVSDPGFTGEGCSASAALTTARW